MNKIKAAIRKHGYKGTKRQCRFVLHYTDTTSNAFMNKAKACEAADIPPNSPLARTLIRVCNELINEKADLMAHRVKAKVFELMEAETTKFFASEGVVIDERTVADNGTQIKAAQLGMKICRIGEEDDGAGGTKVFLIDAAFPNDPSPLPGADPVDLAQYQENDEVETDW